MSNTTPPGSSAKKTAPVRTSAKAAVRGSGSGSGSGSKGTGAGAGSGVSGSGVSGSGASGSGASGSGVRGSGATAASAAAAETTESVRSAEEATVAVAAPVRIPPTAGGEGVRGAAAGTGTASRPAAAAPRPTPRPSTGPRRVRLSISRVDPWSVMKLGFLLSVALGIMTVVAAAVAWKVLDSMGVFADLESLMTDLDAVRQFGVILEYLRLKNIMSLATIVAIVNVALVTALATLGAFVYNIVAALVGGLHMTLTDD